MINSGRATHPHPFPVPADRFVVDSRRITFFRARLLHDVHANAVVGISRVEGCAEEYRGGRREYGNFVDGGRLSLEEISDHLEV